MSDDGTRREHNQQLYKQMIAAQNSKDRAGFGAELVFAVCEAKNVEVVIINQGDNRSFEQELAEDVLEIVTVFSARLYGSRSHKNKKLIEDVAEAVSDAEDA